MYYKYKRLLLILLMLNIVPGVYHNMYLGVKSVKAYDSFADENDGGDGGDDGDDGDDDDDDDDDCSDPGDVSQDSYLHDYFVQGTELYAIQTTTTSNSCSGESSSSDQTVLVDDCTNPSYLQESDGAPHDYYVSGDEIYAVVTHTTYNSCNQISTTEDRDELQQACTDSYQQALSLSDNVSEASDLVDAHVSDIDEFTKNKSPEWVCLRGVGWIMTSREVGKVKLVDSANRVWAWKTLAHGTVAKTGLSVGGSVSIAAHTGEASFTDETAAAHDVLWAGMQLKLDVEYAPAYNCPVINIVFPPYTLRYEPSAFWNATP